MMNIQELVKEAEKLNAHIHEFLKMAGYEQFGEIAVDYKTKDVEQIYQHENLYAYCEHLSQVTEYIDRLNRQIVFIGQLHKNANGRYSLGESIEFTCGSELEYLESDDYHENAYWKYSTVEAKDGEYYLTANPKTQMEGLMVRVKTV